MPVKPLARGVSYSLKDGDERQASRTESYPIHFQEVLYPYPHIVKGPLIPLHSIAGEGWAKPSVVPATHPHLVSEPENLQASNRPPALTVGGVLVEKGCRLQRESEDSQSSPTF